LINCASELPAMNAALAAGSRVITPARCDITENKWSGAGYLAMVPGLQLGAMISGGLAGGFGSLNQTAAQASTKVSNNQQQQKDLSGTAITWNDPIDMARGRFVYDHDDIDAGIGAFPQTLAFKRLYSSGSRTSDGTLGKGWTHNLNITAVTGSDGFQAMGEDSALDAVGSVVEQKVSLDLLMDAARPLNKIVIATLGQRWFGDQLINNTVIVTQGAGAEVFVKLPDGTYNPPPGKSAKLIKNADATFSYESLNRDVLKFNAAGKAESYTDSSGVQVKYVYSGNDVVGIKNSLGRMLALTYANGRISQVTNGVSTVGYSYDAGGNLSAFTDTLSKNTTYSYSLPGRMASIYYPSFPTVAAVTNTYDRLHRVQTQTNARGKTYEYFFAGSRTEEIAPGGGARTNYIDGQGIRDIQADDSLPIQMPTEFLCQFDFVPSFHHKQHFRPLYLLRLQWRHRIERQAGRICLDVRPRREHLFSRWASQAISAAYEQCSHRVPFSVVFALGIRNRAWPFASQQDEK
jgi:YD repeat-containing protein